MTIHPMLTGAHSILYSQKPDEDRAFLRDVLGLPHVDAGDGWLIFGLPPAELAVHPTEEYDRQELYFMCTDRPSSPPWAKRASPATQSKARPGATSPTSPCPAEASLASTSPATPGRRRGKGVSDQSSVYSSWFIVYSQKRKTLFYYKLRTIHYKLTTYPCPLFPVYWWLERILYPLLIMYGI